MANKKQIGADFLQLVTTCDYLEDIANSHINSYQDRYFRKTKSQIKFDLNMNHDPSNEVENCANDLERKLPDDEYNYLVEVFNKKVVSIFFSNRHAD